MRFSKKFSLFLYGIVAKQNSRRHFSLISVHLTICHLLCWNLQPSLLLVSSLKVNFPALMLLTDGDVESNPDQPLTYSRWYTAFSTKIIQNFEILLGYNVSVTPYMRYVGVLWTTWDLDYILENSDCLYKSLINTIPLNVDELPGNVNVKGCSLKVSLLEYQTGIINISNQLHFFWMSFETKSNTGTGAIFFY